MCMNINLEFARVFEVLRAKSCTLLGRRGPIRSGFTLKAFASFSNEIRIYSTILSQVR